MRLVVSENQFFISFILCCLNGAKILTLNLIKLKCKGKFNTWVYGLIFEANLFCKTKPNNPSRYRYVVCSFCCADVQVNVKIILASCRLKQFIRLLMN